MAAQDEQNTEITDPAPTAVENQVEPAGPRTDDTVGDATGDGITVPSVDEIDIDDKMLSRVGKLQDAYAAGEIDDKMISRAAKAIGISEDEARRRLSARVTPKTRSGAGSADRRKRAKQAKASRKRNRG